MAVAKEQTAYESYMGLIQACSFYGSSIQVPDSSSLELYGFENHHKTVLDEGSEETRGSIKNLAMIHLPPLSDSSNVGATNSPVKEVQSVINFKTGYDHFMYSGGSLLSFGQGHSHKNYPVTDHEDDNTNWADAMDQWSQLNPRCGIDTRLSEDLNCVEKTTSYGSINYTAKDNQHGEERFGWLCSAAGATGAASRVQEPGGQEACFHKRPHMGGDIQAPKKHCTGEPRKLKPKQNTSKDPQSIAAKNRRERISERLKILQDLVPNGAKVDLVTMLEKAISYVKFLQLQVKVLATDEFWPVQGGKAPEVAQVKEAIDAILSSQRDR
ncbi:hypothetical protein HHK36_014876 [Tetracentron sinense]|uniref:BHLH domain-containing protein n=1 Tax=Tetracentron sinense TaxID=13715 RepID=A0A834YZS2_TETSI|nr:hypothetical protein HHK36_014876 [Tetracentron sinense]